MTRADLLAKICKIMALAASANEHEAAAALAKVRELMDAHGLDEADIALAAVADVRAKGSGAWTPARWEMHLVDAVARAIPVEPIGRGDAGWSFIGIAPAPEIAAYAFAALYRQLRRARSAYLATAPKRVRTARRKTARADAFAEGWAAAVLTKIARLYPEQPLPDVVRAYLAERLGKMKPIPDRGSNATGDAAARDRGHGWRAGREVDLHHGVAGGASALRIGGGR